MQSQLHVKLTRVPDCWSVVVAAEPWFEPGGNDWQLARASARFRAQAALRSALSPGIRRHMMVTVRGHKAQVTEGVRAVAQSSLVKPIANQSENRDCISTSRAP